MRYIFFKSTTISFVGRARGSLKGVIFHRPNFKSYFRNVQIKPISMYAQFEWWVQTWVELQVFGTSYRLVGHFFQCLLLQHWNFCFQFKLKCDGCAYVSRNDFTNFCMKKTHNHKRKFKCCNKRHWKQKFVKPKQHKLRQKTSKRTEFHIGLGGSLRKKK